MSRFTSLFLVAALLSACSPPEPVFNSPADVYDALSQVENARTVAFYSNQTEASQSEWEREVQMDWVRNHSMGDSSYSMAWTFEDSFMEDGNTSRNFGHLWANELITISKDSVLKTFPMDPDAQRNGNGIPNYYTSLTLPVMLYDTTWWAKQVTDSTAIVEWEHVLPSSKQSEQFILTSTEVQDSTDKDFHPETRSVKKWVFQAPHGLPVRHEQSWYRGDMAYGSDMIIEWNWQSVNDGAVELAISNWTAPQWAHQPEPSENEIAGGGDDNWYEEALAALPAIGTSAPGIEGVDLSGEPIALSDLIGDLVYVDFWYIGCGPCMRAMPHLAHMEKEFGPSGFHVLGVNHHQNVNTVKRYLDRRELEVPQAILDSLPEGYPVVAYPTWFLVGRDGSIIERNMGYGEDTAAFLDSLVSANL